MPAMNDVGQPRDDQDREPGFRPEVPRDEHYNMYLGTNELRATRAMQAFLNTEAARRGMAFREQPDTEDLSSIAIYFTTLRLMGKEEGDALVAAINMTANPDHEDTQAVLNWMDSDNTALHGES